MWVYLATVLIAKGNYQETKIEFKRSRSNMGYKRKRPTTLEIQKYKRIRKDLKKAKKTLKQKYINLIQPKTTYIRNDNYKQKQ